MHQAYKNEGRTDQKRSAQTGPEQPAEEQENFKRRYSDREKSINNDLI